MDLPTSAGFGAAAAGGVWLGLRRSADILDDRRIPLAGLAAAFVFAAQMVNFPVAAGTSGHLLGGVLAAVLLGPWVGSVVVTVVLVVQALVFADGGLTALGLNLFNMALVGAVGGWYLYRAVLRALPNRPGSVPVAAGISAGVSVVLAALCFTLQYALGGEGNAAVGAVAAGMAGVHTVIGVGEGLITAMVVGAVMRTRPDLVAGLPREVPAGG